MKFRTVITFRPSVGVTKWNEGLREFSVNSGSIILRRVLAVEKESQRRKEVARKAQKSRVRRRINVENKKPLC